MNHSFRLAAITLALSTTVFLPRAWSQAAGAPADSEGHDTAAAASLFSENSLPDSPLPAGVAADSSWSSSIQTQTQTQAPTQPQGQMTEEQKRQQAQEQLKIQEQQRVMGVMATFNTTTNHDALPLTPKQKFQLFFKSSTDPWPFTLTAFSALIDQAEGSPEEYGGGIGGYAKRYGASYTDYFTGNFFGNAVFTSWWHEDPRFFQKGTGSKMSRVLWAAASGFWCRRDNGTWGPNYANIFGNLVGSSISNIYYPASERSVGDTFERGFTVTAEGAVGAEVIEFWPDYVRHHRRVEAEKQARKQAEQDAKDAAKAGQQSTQKPQQ
ncbi:hypothetical protein [Silvibacterium sp.]|uniref:hypothetical protein n=1 Tax=Silvibacterium sp. TaxID=1964179 RepID=UPI0039E6DCFD